MNGPRLFPGATAPRGRGREVAEVALGGSVAAPLLGLAVLNAAAGLGLALLGMANGGAVLGTAALAYFLGLRHGFDADHVAAIDNVARKLRQDGARASCTGLFFALGHSTIVVLLSLGVVVTARSGGSAGHWVRTGLHSMAGALCSAAFLTAIGLLNFGLFRQLWKAFSSAAQKPSGDADWEGGVDRLLEQRGIGARLFSLLYRQVDAAWKMYPIGVLFGLGFDTATEIAILALSAGAAAKGALPLWSIMVYPLLFTAGMSLVDTLDGILMARLYDWAFVDGARKLLFNVTITGLSASAAILIAGVQWLHICGAALHLSGPFWNELESASSAPVGLALSGLIVVWWAVGWREYRQLARQGR
jgi:high-affinity nickel-transport protein